MKFATYLATSGTDENRVADVQAIQILTVVMWDMENVSQLECKPQTACNAIE